MSAFTFHHLHLNVLFYFRKVWSFPKNKWTVAVQSWPDISQLQQVAQQDKETSGKRGRERERIHPNVPQHPGSPALHLQPLPAVLRLVPSPHRRYGAAVVRTEQQECAGRPARTWSETAPPSRSRAQPETRQHADRCSNSRHNAADHRADIGAAAWAWERGTAKMNAM